ncbi:MFS transporter [Microbacterium paludicola]|uniref:MFS transporter n=1 Tax=Microbacterium paludicola TaxID=300019 RepID=UPI003879B615
MIARTQTTRLLFGLPGAFFVFLAAVGISDLGDAFRAISLDLWFYTDSDNKEATRLLLVLAGVLPGLLFGPLAGAVADRFSLRRTFLITLIIRGLLSGVLAAIAATTPPGQFAYIVVISSAIASVFFASSAFVFVPRMVEKALLPRANGIAESATWALAAVGPATASIAFAFWGPAPSFLIDAATFLIAAGIFAALIRPDAASTPRGSVTSNLRSTYREFGELLRGIPGAVRHLSRNRLALGMLLASYGVTFTAGVNSFSLIFLIDVELGLPVEALGFVFSWNGVIAVIAALSVGFLVRNANMKRLFLGCLGVLAASQFLMGLAPNVLFLAIGVAVSAFANAPYNVAVATLFQTTIDDEYLGRVEGLDTTVENSLQVAIFLGAAGVVAAVGPRPAMIGAGFIALALLVGGAFLMGRRQPRVAEAESPVSEPTAQ